MNKEDFRKCTLEFYLRFDGNSMWGLPQVYQAIDWILIETI